METGAESPMLSKESELGVTQKVVWFVVSKVNVGGVVLTGRGVWKGLGRGRTVRVAEESERTRAEQNLHRSTPMLLFVCGCVSVPPRLPSAGVGGSGVGWGSLIDEVKL